MADDASALTDKQRAEQLAVISRDKLALEREEEALNRAAAAQGLDIARRADADPRAVFSIADTALQLT